MNERRTSLLLSAFMAAVFGVVVGVVFSAWLPGVLSAVIFFGVLVIARVLREKIDRDSDRRYPAVAVREDSRSRFIADTVADDARNRPTAPTSQTRRRPRWSTTSSDAPASVNHADAGDAGSSCDSSGGGCV
ncbi:hypothetical protein [Rhodococcus sp. T7]|uniref:hypothetical protein n=1 Tax=Rhodococcus sp. T7 TaxID=627444 RepID=UPI001357124B|nr:hypothetical protein [Rhodococcus sp. T7]KAF0966407.1 hypothetical protein MLGJGCBP_00426 [Rhodococcus sp. T7]